MNKENILALRVMRLTKPLMTTSTNIFCEENDIFGADESITGVATGTELFNTDQLLMLPQSFGNIFLGETFVSYISVHNDSSQVAQEVLVKADLQTGSQRFVLSQPAAVPVLEPDHSIDDVIRHEVKELGTHIMNGNQYVVSIDTCYGHESLLFQVMKPLDVKTKFYSPMPNKIFLESQIQNITPNAMCMEKVSLEPLQMFQVEQLNQTSENLSTFGKECYIKPNETRQYLFQLSLKKEFLTQNFDKPQTSVGKLDIIWKTILGERGRLQTSQLQRPAPVQTDLKVNINSIPINIQQLQSFEIECEITNYSQRPRQLTVLFENKTSILWQGISNFSLDKIPPKTSIPLKCQLIAISSGLVPISGLRLVDHEINRTYEYDNIQSILVDPLA